ncbi:aldo/keto reductase [Microvirga terrae]|uniref:Aldo/keto reductase n=1 Tax=Microvirga terrae TaxID=2740529 RepID=A0ABY5RWE4_9HYPH|nr:MULTISPECIES: aldo/keto reductase [Microvirga]MBQ0821092.1 aldo/keto reductase [Microvirga sp. HBU67558]UVF21571.1 aldo/keto reductase [Microvirga terrae]
MTCIAATMPTIGLGTYGRTGDAGMASILAALELGYRHIDTAQSYDTERPVGEAFRRSGIPREQVFITTKVADTKLDRVGFMPSVEESLETLGLDHVDLLLIHWPSQNNAVPFEDYMTELKRAQDIGHSRFIGVSNFPIAMLEQTRALLGDGAVVTNQVEIHPYLQAPRLSNYARSIGLPLTAYQPLAQGDVRSDPVLVALGERHGVTPAAVALAFLMAEGHAVIPASSNPVNLRENMRSLEVRLSDDEMGQIRALNRSERRINPTKSPRWDD